MADSPTTELQDLRSMVQGLAGAVHTLLEREAKRQAP